MHIKQNETIVLNAKQLEYVLGAEVVEQYDSEEKVWRVIPADRVSCMCGKSLGAKKNHAGL